MPRTSIVIYDDVRYAGRHYSFIQEVRKSRMSYRYPSSSLGLPAASAGAAASQCAICGYFCSAS